MREVTRREFLAATAKAGGVLAASAMLSEANAAPISNHVPELVQMDALELSRAIRAKSVSCREVMTTYLDHIERFNPKVNAMVSLQERAGLMRQAAERDEQLAQGKILGWMHGFPHAVKDLAATKGIRTTWGSPLLDTVPTEDALFVQRLKRNGVIVIGKTNAPEFGLGSQSYNPVFGTTLNAYDQTKAAGGSSGGAAVSLALRMVPVADGSDMMGSLRNPAAFNNVLGFRTSFGRVPSGGKGEMFLETLSTAGPMGRSVTDVAMLLSVMAGPDSRMPFAIEQDPARFTEPLKRDFKGTRLGWLGDFNGYLATEPGVLELCQSSFKAFESVGCTVEPARVDFAPEKIWQCWLTLRHWLTAGDLGPLYSDPAKRAKMKPEAQWEVEGGLPLTASQVYAASEARSDWYRAVNKLFETHDYLLLPSAQVFPFDAQVHWPKEINGRKMDTYHRWMEVVVPATLSGCPVINVPVGFSSNRLPMGMQIIGKNHDDLSVLQMAYAYEQATHWVRDNPPPLLQGN
ncbi:MAG TPA: amidase [Terriglobales bacterium]|nr:amidase [Terriglobales bacterium]